MPDVRQGVPRDGRHGLNQLPQPSKEQNMSSNFEYINKAMPIALALLTAALLQLLAYAQF